jgi:hypothetical protein
MNENEELRIRQLLKDAFPPERDLELRADLWPRMLRRLAERGLRPTWLDWALAALVPLWFVWRPELIPALLYHL